MLSVWQCGKEKAGVCVPVCPGEHVVEERQRQRETERQTEAERMADSGPPGRSCEVLAPRVRLWCAWELVCQHCLHLPCTHMCEKERD